MTCIDFEMFILDQKEGLLEESDRIRLIEHLKTCTACQQFQQDIDAQDNLFQFQPQGIVPPVSVVDAVLNRIQIENPIPNHNASNSISSATKTAKTIVKLVHTVKANLFVVVTTSTIVSAAAITSFVVMNESQQPLSTVSTPEPTTHFIQSPVVTESDAPLDSRTELINPVQSITPLPSNQPVDEQSPLPTMPVTPMPSVVPSPTDSNTPNPSENPTPTPTASPTPTPSARPQGTTFVNADIRDLVLGWKIPNLDDTKLIYIHKQGSQEDTLKVQVVKGSYHVQDPNNIYMNGSGAPIRVVQFYDDQFIELEISYKEQRISIWVDLSNDEVVEISGN